MATEHELAKQYRIASIAVLAVTFVRVLVLILSPLNLYPDEAQYWSWAQAPAFGYFSKPPLIAFIVWFTTNLFGNSEWAIRLAAPIFHGATSLMLFGIARIALPDRPKVPLWSALSFLTLPGVSYSSGLISTDVPLLFFWAVALYAFLRARRENDWRWPILCGVAIGFGLLAKYAMLYFLLGALAAVVVSPAARRVVFSLKGLAILAIALAIFSPNIIWNATNGFPTVHHTEANAGWSHARYSLAAFAGFLGGQFGVFGPILMVGLIAAVWRIARAKPREEFELLLAAFCLPPLLLILVQAFIAGANANWAAPTYVAATPLAVDALLRWGERRAMWVSFAFDSLAMVLLWIILVAPSFADRIGVGNAFKREEGWRELGAAVTYEASRAPYDAIATENRSVIAELLYYAAPLGDRLRIWDRGTKTANHFEMTRRLTAPASRVLLVTEPDAAPDVLATFDSSVLKQTIATPIGGHKIRAVRLYDARNYLGPSKLP